MGLNGYLIIGLIIALGGGVLYAHDLKSQLKYSELQYEAADQQRKSLEAVLSAERSLTQKQLTTLERAIIRSQEAQKHKDSVEYGLTKITSTSACSNSPAMRYVFDILRTRESADNN